jgi:WD40 repeat protein
MSLCNPARTLFAVATLLVFDAVAAAQEVKPIAIAEIKRDSPVDFQKEVLPILNKHCVACHNAATNEGSLILESPAAILKGGDSGPSVIAKKSVDSYLLQVASRQSEPYMPPLDNKVNATPLSPEELGILKLWIDQGATGSVSAATSDVSWQPLPPGINPIYAVAVTDDGQFAACGRANQVFIYHVPSGKVICRLTDAELLKSGPYKNPGVAHLDIVQSLAFSPDGYLLASSGYQEAKLWRRPTNVQLFKGDSGSVITVLAASADRKQFATGGDKVIKLWDAAAGKPTKDLSGHTAAVTALAFSADGTKLFSASADKTIRIWKLPDGEAIGQVEAPAPVAAITVIGDGTRIATGGGDNSIRIWTVSAEAPFLAAAKELTGHSGPVASLVTVPTANTQIVSGSADGTVRLWNADNGQMMRQIAHGGPVASVAVRGDGVQIASAGGNYARLWNLADGKQLAEVKGDYRAQNVLAKANKVNETAKTLITQRKNELAAAEKDVPVKTEAAKKAKDALAAADKTLAEKAEVVKKATEAKAAAEKAAADAATAAKEAMDKATAAKDAAEKDKENKDLATARTAAEKAAVDAAANAKKLDDAAKATAKPLTDAEKPLKDAESAQQTAKRAADDAGEVLKKATELVPATKQLIGTAEAEQKQTEAALEAAKRAAAETEKPVRTVAFSPDNTQLATAGDDQLVHTWSVADGAPQEIYIGHAGSVATIAYTSDNTVVSAAADKLAIGWNLNPEWTLERTIGGAGKPEFVDRVISLDFSPDGKLLATGGGEPSRSGELKLWNVADGKLVRELAEAHSDTVFGVDFSADGKYLASSAADKFVKVFEVASGKFVRSFEGHTHHVLGVSWQTDGKTLASAGADNVIKVWNFETGEQKRTIQGFGKQVTSISFVGDTVNTISASGDKSVRLHRTDNGQNVRTYGGGTDFMNAAMATPNGKLVVAGGQDSVLWLWNGDNGQVIKNLPPPQSAAADQQAAK